MTEIILTFPVRRRASLSCIWFKTGNPVRPLACKWVVSEQAADDCGPALTAEPHVCRNCA
ncbi:hypothetical protein SBA5_650030 [Candidatus Sulfotelmatomonas gaucii]|uniref:Uncharacterized protein n=1 Tax=Candidatus Sulfuritelmatomonas gaucii TaxID=2043161 RepID=A0A2N9LYW6_9BACT|nr:hypothetical protein SBA5_650030 [Candidatus Sulfotelmatomonas gaucii]